MQRIQRSMLVAAPPAAAFQVVNDVRAYQDFLPRCKGSRVLESGAGWLNAELKIAASPIAVKFRTHNVWRDNERIEIAQLSGPFTELQGVWTFQAAGDERCKIELDLSFKLKPPLNLAIRPQVFEQATAQIASAFQARIEGQASHPIK